jgi:hypothetical protein
MRLDVVDHGHAPAEAAILEQIAQARGVPTASGVLKTLYYRPEIFGRPFSAALDEAMRGPSEWSPGERELFAGFVSLLNQCPF